MRRWAGHKYAQDPNSMQFMTASSSSATTSWLREAETSANGSRASGHARTQRPQRMLLLLGRGVQASELDAIGGLSLADGRGDAAMGRAQICAGSELHAVHDGKLVERDHVMAARGGNKRERLEGQRACAHAATAADAGGHVRKDGGGMQAAAACRATRGLWALRIGQSMFVMVRPNMGPPKMIFFGSLTMPPVASMTSRTLMPSGMR